MKTKIQALLFTVAAFTFPITTWASTNNTASAVVAAASATEQTQNAVQPVSNPGQRFMDAFLTLGGVISSPFSARNERGLQFKNPVLSPGVTYRHFDDTAVGGFTGNEYGGDVGLDADVYDGLIVGALYQFLHRGASNQFGTSENLDSNGVSVYAAKRFYNLLNVGLSYNYATTDHDLTRAVKANLDRDSHGFAMFAGISDKKGKWGWSLTPSFSFINDDYDQQLDLDTGRVAIAGGLSYDITKWFTLGTAFSYNNFVIQDTFANTSVRDNDYWTIGPQFAFYPMDNLAVTLTFDTQEGFKDYKAYTVRLGTEISF